VEIHALDGEPIISYVNDGERWSLNQRGWDLHGTSDEEPPLPEEISLVVRWFDEAAGMLENVDSSIDSIASLRITEDFSEEIPGATTRRLSLSIRSGVLRSIDVVESTFNGTETRPGIQLLAATRDDDIDTELFRVGGDPQFPEIDTTAPRFDVPEDEWEQLTVISMTVGDEQGEEVYRIQWNDVELDMKVRPSRGGLEPSSVPQSIDAAWTIAYAEYRWGSLVWAYRHFAGYPTDGLWDDGRFLFVVATDRQQMSTEHEWNLDELIKLANALSFDPLKELSDSESSGVQQGYGFPWNRSRH
jgi:hypothetical protein